MATAVAPKEEALVLLQKPVTPAALWWDEVVVQLDDQIIWQGAWDWNDQVGPT